MHGSPKYNCKWWLHQGKPEHQQLINGTTGRWYINPWSTGIPLCCTSIRWYSFHPTMVKPRKAHVNLVNNKQISLWYVQCDALGFKHHCGPWTQCITTTLRAAEAESYNLLYGPNWWTWITDWHTVDDLKQVESHSHLDIIICQFWWHDKFHMLTWKSIVIHGLIPVPSSPLS